VAGLERAHKQGRIGGRPRVVTDRAKVAELRAPASRRGRSQSKWAWPRPRLRGSCRKRLRSQLRAVARDLKQSSDSPARIPGPPPAMPASELLLAHIAGSLCPTPSLDFRKPPQSERDGGGGSQGARDAETRRAAGLTGQC
jgi:hypothetical protein